MRTPSENQANKGRSTFSFYLHYQIHKAFVVVARHRCVRTHHQVPANSFYQVDVLPWKQGRKSTS